MNLHAVVRGAITAVARDLPAELYTMTGEQERGERGDLLPVFAEPVPVLGQWQSIKADEIIKTERINEATTVRRVYLRATDDASSRPWASWRPLGRSGDLLKDDRGAFWLVDAVIEDFTHEGWVCVQAVLQTVPPRFKVKEPTDGGS